MSLQVATNLSPVRLRQRILVAEHLFQKEVYSLAAHCLWLPVRYRQIPLVCRAFQVTSGS